MDSFQSVYPNAESARSYHRSSPPSIKQKNYSYATHRIIERKNKKLWKFHTCKLCSFKTKSFYKLRKHRRGHRVFRSQKIFSCADIIDKYECRKCEYKTELLVQLKKHVAVLHPQVKRQKDDEPHWWRPALMKSNQNTVKRYSCESCDFTTHSRLLCMAHFRSCSQDLDVNQNTCNESTEWPELDVQKSGISTFQCSMCSYSAKRKTTLEGHMKVKHPFPVVNFSKKYKTVLSCKGCSYKTKYKLALTKHALTCASKSISFQCNMCSFEGKRNGILKKHILEAHIAPKATHVVADSPVVFWFECESCSFKTKEQLVLNEHILSEHVVLEKVVCFKCQLCTYKTIERGELNEHVLNKHVDPQNTDWYKCEMCTDTFKKTDLKKHILEQHIL
ncbi:hypothetical protein MTP99_017853 [Tenebrio molitor]|nr:hypothetical protein MTP99_017853 [Tenebrio molitor]